MDITKLIDEAIAKGKGWTPEEARKYFDELDESKYEHPLFAENEEVREYA
jgi:polyhydroxyalkanoate synthesis regulator phasin